MGCFIHTMPFGHINRSRRRAARSLLLATVILSILAPPAISQELPWANVDCSGDPADDITITYDPDAGTYSQNQPSTVTCTLTTNSENATVTAELSGDFSGTDTITLTHTNGTNTIDALITNSTGFTDSPPADYSAASITVAAPPGTPQDFSYEMAIDETTLPGKPAGDYSGSATITISGYE